jgi:PAS domain S-box-containing protein
MPTLGRACAVAIAFFLAARLGLALLAAGTDMAVFWPASGIAAGFFIVSRRRTFPALAMGVIVATIAAGLFSDRGPLTSLFNGFWNAGEPLLLVWLLDWWFDQPFIFRDLRHVVGFLVAGGLATAAMAVGGAATLTLLHTETISPYWEVWREWFLSGWVGMAVVAPLIVAAAQTWRNPPSQKQWFEGVGVLGLMALACSITIIQKTGTWLSYSPGVFVVPLLLWLAARCQPAFGIAGAFIASISVILATTFGIGHFGDAAIPIMQRVTGAQFSVMTVTLFTLVLNVLFAQRTEAEGRLTKKRAILARLHEVGTRLWLKRDLPRALDEILAGAIELLRADMGAIRILDVTRNTLKVEAQRGFGQGFLNCFGEVGLDGGTPCCRAVRSAERVVIEDVEADALFTPFRPMARAAGYRAVQTTPIGNCEGIMLGTLATHFRSAHKPDNDDLRLLDLYVRQAAEIIERHRAEDALRESEERLRLTQLRTGIGTWDWNLHTGRITCTSELEALFGLEHGSIKSYADFRDRVHPDDIAAIEARRIAAVQRHETFRYEFRIIRADGQVRWIAAVGGALYDESTGDPVRILGNNADITERKLAELALAERNALLKLAGKTARVGWYVNDVERDMLTVSEGYNAIHGLPEGTTETALKHWRTRVHQDDLPQFDEMRKRTFGNRHQDYIFDYRIIRSDGEIRWIESRGIVTYDSNDRPKRVTGINIDVTEHKRIEAHQSKLVAELDHRVKNTLATVSAVATRTQESSASMAEFVTALDGRIKSMALAHELLSRRRWQGIPLAELVHRELEPYANSNNTRVGGPEVMLSAEAGQILAMVFHELATNAAKFGAISARSGCVSVQWTFRPSENAESLLCVDWVESGGPRVVPPTRSGFGTTLVRELLPYELGGKIDLMHLSEGIRCKLEIPQSWLRVEHAGAGVHSRTSHR